MKMNKKTKWTDHLSKSSKGHNVFFVRYTKYSVWSYWSNGHDFKKKIYQVLDDYKILFYNQSSGGSPAGHLESEEIAYSFLDGGFVTSHTNAVYGTFGSWIIGYDALRFILSHFNDIIQPKKLKNECSIKTVIEMELILHQQLINTDILLENAKHLYEDYGNNILIKS
jgi:hypothetical protein